MSGQWRGRIGKATPPFPIHSQLAPLTSSLARPFNLLELIQLNSCYFRCCCINQRLIQNILNRTSFLFFQFDPEGFGEIPWEDFGAVLKSPQFRNEVHPHKIEQLEEKRLHNGSSAITFQEFVNVVSFRIFFHFPLPFLFSSFDSGA